MSLENTMKIAGSGMGAQSVRLNTVASNLANMNSISGTEMGAYRSRIPVFEATLMESLQDSSSQQNIAEQAQLGVTVSGIVETDNPVRREYSPGHPLANEEGYIFHSNVNMVDELTNMIDASKQYRVNVEMLNTGKTLMMRTIGLLES